MVAATRTFVFWLTVADPSNYMSNLVFVFYQHTVNNSIYKYNSSSALNNSNNIHNEHLEIATFSPMVSFACVGQTV